MGLFSIFWWGASEAPVRARPAGFGETAFARFAWRSERALGLRRGIVGAPDRLIIVDHRSGHQAGLIRRQKSDGARNLMGVDETAKWLRGRRLFEPIRACTVMLALNP